MTQMGVWTCFTSCSRQKNDTQTIHTVQVNEKISKVENAKFYSYKELQIATENFKPVNKIGEGGFGSVYKGRLKNGTFAAIKVLSVESEQGVEEFITEIVVISGMEHENLVKLYGCCTEGNHRILVYGYLENSSLAQTLLGGRLRRALFTWKRRTKICVGVAQGLAFLHHEVQPHIVHRDINASNVLLDKDFNPKISDFGLAKLFPANMTHVSTRVAGTFGYLAPEYAVRGKLTRKADIYSFGVLLIEIVSGRWCINKRLPAGDRNILDRAWRLYEKGELVQLVDTSLEGNFNHEEACKYLKIGLLCTQDLPRNRPNMSTVVKMLIGDTDVDGINISKPGLLRDPLITSKGSTSASASSQSWGSKDKSLPSQSTDVLYATMTSTSMHDRGN